MMGEGITIKCYGASNSSSQTIGQRAEAIACRYLKRRGLRLVARNFRCSLGEIDLVMWDNANLVFVEVRCRKHAGYGGGLESVTRHKRRRLWYTAELFLKYRRAEHAVCRFDVVSVHLGQDLQWVSCEWVRDAFTYDDV